VRTIAGDRLSVTVTGSSRDGLTIEDREGSERLVSAAEVVDAAVVMNTSAFGSWVA
jgi:hypothetical protein